MLFVIDKDTTYIYIFSQKCIKMLLRNPASKMKLTNLAVCVIIRMIYRVKMVGPVGLEPTTNRL